MVTEVVMTVWKFTSCMHIPLHPHMSIVLYMGSPKTRHLTFDHYSGNRFQNFSSYIFDEIMYASLIKMSTLP